MTVLPNIYDSAQLREFAAAPDTPRLSAEELARIAELKRDNFGAGPEQGRFKGTMSQPDDAALPAHPSPEPVEGSRQASMLTHR